MLKKSTKNNSDNKAHYTSVHHLAVIELRKLGYPIVDIRKALHKLTRTGQTKMAKRLVINRMKIVKNIDGTRNNPDVQDGICRIWEIPPEVLFEDKRSPHDNT